MPTEPVGAPFDRIRALLEFLGQIREWFPDLSLADLIEIAKAAATLLPLPDLADEAGCRQWCRRLNYVLDEVADMTTTTLDDTILENIEAVIEDDTLWGLLWSLVEWTTSDKVGAPVGDELAARWSVDWEKLAALIQAIVDFINTWK